MAESKYININDFIDNKYKWLFVIGARGVGKTVNSIAWAIKKAYQNHQKFIYLRRYQTEIDTLGLNLSLLSKITDLKVELDRQKDDSGRFSTMITANGQGVGYLIALSVAAKYKSTDYTGTFVIIYDEFIDIRGRELKNEVNLFLNFAMTVFRNFADFNAVFLANATDPFNCYFIAYNILPKGLITKNKELGIKIVMYRTSGALNERNKTQLAKLVFALDNDDSALTNNFKISDDFVQKQKANAKCKYIINLQGTDYGIWLSDSYTTISKKYDPSVSRVSIDSLNEEYDYKPYFIVGLSDALKRKHLTFSDTMTRGIWLKAMKERNLI